MSSPRPALRRRLLITSICAGLAVATTSCSSGSSTTTQGSKKGGTIAYVPPISGSPFFQTISCGVKSAVTKAGYKFIEQAPPKFDAGQQTQVVQALQQRSPAAMVVDVVASKELRAPLTALARTTRLVTSLEPVTIPGQYASVLFDQRNFGKLQAQALVKKMGKTGQVFLLDYQAGDTTLDQRYQGAAAELAKYTGIKVVSHQYAVGDPTKAAQLTSAVLQAHPGLTGVITTDVYSTPGVVNAVKEAKATSKVTVVSADEVPSTIAEVKAGQIYAFIATKNYELGKQSGQAAVQAAKGKKAAEIPSYVPNAQLTITSANLATANAADYVSRTTC